MQTRNLIAIGAAALCVAPSLACNVWPRVALAFPAGIAIDPHEATALAIALLGAFGPFMLLVLCAAPHGERNQEPVAAAQVEAVADTPKSPRPRRRVRRVRHPPPRPQSVAALPVGVAFDLVPARQDSDCVIAP
jgi:hypothetical protein